MGPTMSYYNLRDALTQPGCAVCRMRGEAVDRFLETLLWENVNDIDIRDDIRRARGFCREHAWAMADKQVSLGTAIIMQDVLKNSLRALDGASYRDSSLLLLRQAVGSGQPNPGAAELATQLAPQAPCLVCIRAEEMEGVHLDNLVEHMLDEDGLLAAFESSDGLCLGHFRQAMIRVRNEAIFEALIDVQRAVWERLVDQLGETIRKSDYRFRDELWGEESGAWLRALYAVAGARYEPDNKP